MESMSEMAHRFLQPVLHGQAICVDATLGHGRDAAFFLEKGVRHVYAFEIQPDLLAECQKHLPDSRFHPFLKSHAEMETCLPQDSAVDAVIFNFGYDPKTMAGICTEAPESLKAVQTAARLLKSRGRMSLVFYPHAAGSEEKAVILDWLALQPDLEVLKIEHPFKEHAPSLVCIEKKPSRKPGKGAGPL